MSAPQNHDRGHDHDHGRENYDHAFAVGVTLNVIFVLIEAGYGLTTDSLALLADAGHNLSDVLGLLLAWGASVMARSGRTQAKTYGLKKATIMAAMFNALILLVAVGGISREAFRRFGSPAPTSGTTIMVVAGIGIVINVATMLLFMRGRNADLNIRGAFLHMAADAVVSLGVVLAGLAIVATGATWIDPVVSLVIAVVILLGTWSLLSESANLAVDGVPRGIDLAAVSKELAALPEVRNVHDLHVWAMSTTETALTAHLVRPGPGGHDEVIRQADAMLRRKFGIRHTTLQVESESTECPSGTDC